MVVQPLLVTDTVQSAELAVTLRTEMEEEQDLTEVAVRSAPPFLISAIFHAVLLIVLALWVFAVPGQSQVSLQVLYAEKLGEQLDFDSPLIGLDEADQEPELSKSELPEVEDPFAAPPELNVSVEHGNTASSKIEANAIGLALEGRREGMKKALLGRYGGNATTEAAVQRGLEWLARKQKPEGYWSLQGAYPDGAGSENQAAATAMALLAFQGAGNTHQSGRFKTNVAKAWRWLLEEQDAEGNFFHDGQFNAAFYTQGQCTIAACEIYGMTKDPKFKEPAERAIKYCIDTQSPMGGWKYVPRERSDVSVTGWVVMALQSARMAGLTIPEQEERFRRIGRFLDKCTDDGGSRYGYEPGRASTLAMTAEALLCRQYLGWPHDDERLNNGCRWLFNNEENLVNFNRKRDAYYWYYATQVAHHMGGEYWENWNTVMRQEVPRFQVTSGPEAGSWSPVKPTRDQWEANGGRLYVTCLHIYMLEVYYRHLPIYHKVYSQPLLPGL